MNERYGFRGWLHMAYRAHHLPFGLALRVAFSGWVSERGWSGWPFTRWWWGWRR